MAALLGAWEQVPTPAFRTSSRAPLIELVIPKDPVKRRNRSSSSQVSSFEGNGYRRINVPALMVVALQQGVGFSDVAARTCTVRPRTPSPVQELKLCCIINLLAKYFSRTPDICHQGSCRHSLLDNQRTCNTSAPWTLSGTGVAPALRLMQDVLMEE
jgi:hypothetical protein